MTFTDFATGPPRTWQQKLLRVGMVVLLASRSWDQRGVVFGLFACLMWGAIFLPPAFDPDRVNRVRAPSLRRDLLDHLYSAPLFFCALASLVSWPLLTCAAIAVATSAILAALTVRRWRKRQAPTRNHTSS